VHHHYLDGKLALSTENKTEPKKIVEDPHFLEGTGKFTGLLPDFATPQFDENTNYDQSHYNKRLCSL